MESSETQTPASDHDSFERVEPNEIAFDASVAERVAVFSVRRNPTRQGPKFRASDLSGALSALPAEIAIVAFVESTADADGVGAMVDRFVEADADALTCYVPATSAVKRVESGVVVESVDRSRLFSLRAPQIVNRMVVEQGLAMADEAASVDVADLVASAGGSVVLLDAA